MTIWQIWLPEEGGGKSILIERHSWIACTRTTETQPICTFFVVQHKLGNVGFLSHTNLEEVFAQDTINISAHEGRKFFAGEP